MRLSVSMCVIGSLICNQNDELHVILTILILQCSHIKNDTPSLCIPVATMGNVSHHQKSCNFADLKHSTTITVLYWIWQPRILTLTCSSSYSVYKPRWSHSDLHLYSICCLCSVKVGWLYFIMWVLSEVEREDLIVDGYSVLRTVQDTHI